MNNAIQLYHGNTVLVEAVDVGTGVAISRVDRTGERLLGEPIVIITSERVFVEKGWEVWSGGKRLVDASELCAAVDRAIIDYENNNRADSVTSLRHAKSLADKLRQDTPNK